MSNKDTGGPAFPCSDIIERDAKGHLHGSEISGSGLTIRDYFAAQALPSIMATRQYYAGMDQPPEFKQYAQRAYSIADAMLETRKS